MTFDEAFTYLYVLNPRGLYDVYIANNHLLNSILVKILTIFFGNSILVIRITAILGTSLYLIGTYKISKIIFNKTIFFVFSVLILTLNPMALDFLSLSRGYSLALGLMMLGLYFFFKTLLKIDSIQKNNLYCFLFLTLSITAILTFLYVFIAVVIVCCCLELNNILKSKEEDFLNYSFIKKILYLLKSGKKTIIIPLIPCVIILFFITLFFLIPLYIYSGGLYIGVADINRTVISIVTGSLQEDEHVKWETLEITPLTAFCMALIYLSVISFSILFIWRFILILRKKDTLQLKERNLLGASALLFICIILLFLQYFAQKIVNFIIFKTTIYNANFPRNRAALYLVPLFSLFLITFWKYIFDVLKEKYNHLKILKSKKYFNLSFYLEAGSTQIYFCIFFIFLILSGLNSLNLTHVYHHKLNAPTKFVIDDLIEMNPNEKRIDLYANEFLEGALTYYKELYDLDWLNLHNIHDKNFKYDYYLLWYDGDYQEVIINQKNLEVVHYYQIGDLYLFK